ncbi:MAG: carotenoid 1,2-hydratase [Paracoccaceae bacterium]
MAFIGSVFSPWYRWSGRRHPHNHVCINVALYGPGGRFTMTERGAAALTQTTDRFQVGPSSLEWRNGELVIDVDEISNPIISRLKGQIRLKPAGITDVEMPLKSDGTHIWRPFAPTARIEVDLGRDRWRWNGHGYFDANFGTRALEDDFSYWTWGRFPVPGGTMAFYDADRRDGTTLARALMFTEDGRAEMIETPPPKTPFNRNLWLVRRETRADPGYRPREVTPMLHAPFYSRAAVRTKIEGRETVGVHEALDLDRFASPLLKPMLAVRVPRVPDWAAFGRKS